MIWFALGLVTLLLGAELLVRGASRLALSFGISPLVVGLTAMAVACLPIFFTGNLIARWEGGLYLAYYTAYTAYLILDAAGHDTQSGFSTIMGSFVLPLTVITLLVLAWRHWQQPERSPS